MDIKRDFPDLWREYFDGAELPIAFYYADKPLEDAMAKPPAGRRCFIADLARVRRGESLCFDAGSIGCPGGKRYLGFSHELMPNFEYFLSCGIPGKLEGERYKKSPELVREAMKRAPAFHAPAPWIVFKRWDRLDDGDRPEVAVFFARPDVLSGLFTLSSFDEVETSTVYAPFSAGCGSIVQYPYLEKDAAQPRCILGMFDVSARPFVPEDTLTFAVPMANLERMVRNMKESFLIASSWAAVRRRIEKAAS
ncbi:DUF169 domain-containing protein [Candidatus Sumerlaeota bacterium]|nr:DUF169 domain-containing protein [Candidatus Sumerlaeota bacterium]